MGNGRDVELVSPVGLAHVTGPLGMEGVNTLSVLTFRQRTLPDFLRGIQISLNDVLGLGNGIGVDGLALHHLEGEALYRAGDTQLIAAPGKDGVHEAGAGHDRRRRGNAHINGEGDKFLLVKLGRNLIGVRTRRNLEGGFILPAQILAEAHPVVADVPAAPELLRRGDGLPTSQRTSGVGGGMLNHGDDRPDIDILIDDHILAGSLIHDLGGQRLQNAVVDLELQFLAVLATEHLGNNLVRTHHVGRKTGIGIVFDIVENHRRTAVQQFLETCHFLVGIDFLIRLQDQPLFP